jgi:hypothetical protein
MVGVGSVEYLSQLTSVIPSTPMALAIFFKLSRFSSLAFRIYSPMQIVQEGLLDT